MGACASVGGVFDNYAHRPGCRSDRARSTCSCPAARRGPKSLIYGIVQLQKKIDQQRMSALERSIGPRSDTLWIRLRSSTRSRGLCPAIRRGSRSRPRPTGCPTIYVAREHLVDACRALRDHPALRLRLPGRHHGGRLPAARAALRGRLHPGLARHRAASATYAEAAAGEGAGARGRPAHADGVGGLAGGELGRARGLRPVRASFSTAIPTCGGS